MDAIKKLVEWANQASYGLGTYLKADQKTFINVSDFLMDITKVVNAFKECYKYQQAGDREQAINCVGKVMKVMPGATATELKTIKLAVYEAISKVGVSKLTGTKFLKLMESNGFKA